MVVLTKAIRGLYYDTRTLLSTIRSTFNPVTRRSEGRRAGPRDGRRAARARRPRRRAAHRLGGGDDESHRQHALQRPPADDLHFQLRGRAGRRRPRFAARARRVSHALAAAGDVRVPRVRRTGLPRVRVSPDGQGSLPALEGAAAAAAPAPGHDARPRATEARPARPRLVRRPRPAARLRCEALRHTERGTGRLPDGCPAGRGRWGSTSTSRSARRSATTATSTAACSMRR